MNYSFTEEPNENNTPWDESKEYETVDGEFTDKDFYQIHEQIDNFYDDYRRRELKKIMKRAGGITALGLSLIALIIDRIETFWQ